MVSQARRKYESTGHWKVEHLSLSRSLSLTHTHTHTSFQPDVRLRYDRRDCAGEGDDRRYAERHLSRLHHQPDELLQTEKDNKYDFK